MVKWVSSSGGCSGLFLSQAIGLSNFCHVKIDHGLGRSNFILPLTTLITGGVGRSQCQVHM